MQIALRVHNIVHAARDSRKQRSFASETERNVNVSRETPVLLSFTGKIRLYIEKKNKQTCWCIYVFFFFVIIVIPCDQINLQSIIGVTEVICTGIRRRLRKKTNNWVRGDLRNVPQSILSRHFQRHAYVYLVNIKNVCFFERKISRPISHRVQ